MPPAVHTYDLTVNGVIVNGATLGISAIRTIRFGSSRLFVPEVSTHYLSIIVKGNLGVHFIWLQVFDYDGG